MENETIRLEEWTIVDAPIYRRVSDIRNKINNMLIDKLVEKGAERDDVQILVEKADNGSSCCESYKITVFVEYKE